jgi:hypothetical protein
MSLLYASHHFGFGSRGVMSASAGERSFDRAEEGLNRW